MHWFEMVQCNVWRCFCCCGGGGVMWCECAWVCLVQNQKSDRVYASFCVIISRRLCNENKRLFTTPVQTTRPREFSHSLTLLLLLSFWQSFLENNERKRDKIKYSCELCIIHYLNREPRIRSQQGYNRRCIYIYCVYLYICRKNVSMVFVCMHVSFGWILTI